MSRHLERHYAERIGWLRASVLGANDGIVSTASLIVGIAASSAGHTEILTAGLAGLVAGAMSMAAGEYVSVSSQADTENADLERERVELKDFPEAELKELTNIYVQRGLSKELALQVAKELTAHDALATHAREELGLTEIHTARPVQAALASAGTFAVGAALPLVLALVSPPAQLIPIVSAGSLLLLAFLGGLAANVGGAKIWIGAARVTFWGALAMLATAGVGALFGTVVP